jgi:hypothetical protein
MDVGLFETQPGDGMELVGGGDPSPVVQGYDVYGRAKVVLVQEWESGLVAVVGEEEVAGGGGVAPSAADGAAAEEGLGGQADEYLPDGDLIGEAAVERRRSCSCGLRHGRRLGDLSWEEQSEWLLPATASGDGGIG